jgi:hypothetical protein
VIGPVGARRALALLVIGDAVLGGVFVGVLLRPTGETARPTQGVTSTTSAAPVAANGPIEEVQDAPDVAPRETTPSAPTTTAPAPSTSAAAPTTVPRVEPRVAEVTTTAPATTPSTTFPSSTTAAAPIESGE